VSKKWAEGRKVACGKGEKAQKEEAQKEEAQKEDLKEAPQGQEDDEDEEEDDIQIALQRSLIEK
jgi:hypothetical protein